MKLLLELFKCDGGYDSMETSESEAIARGIAISTRADHMPGILDNTFFRSISIGGYSMIELRIIVTGN